MLLLLPGAQKKGNDIKAQEWSSSQGQPWRSTGNQTVTDRHSLQLLSRPQENVCMTVLNSSFSEFY